MLNRNSSSSSSTSSSSNAAAVVATVIAVVATVIAGVATVLAVAVCKGLQQYQIHLTFFYLLSIDYILKAFTYEAV